MSDNRLNATLSPEQRAAVEQALQTLRDNLSFLQDLSPTERQDLFKMGARSEAFVRAALDVARQNPDILPRSFDVDAFADDVALYDALRDVHLSLQQLFEHVDDTRMLAGAEAMAAARLVYHYAKGAPAGAALDGAAAAMSERFARRRKNAG